PELFGVRGRTDMAGPVGNEASSAVLLQFGHMRTDLRTWSLSPGRTSWIEANAAPSPRNHGEWRVENNPERIRHAPRPPDPPRTGRVAFLGIAGEPTRFAPVSHSPSCDAVPRRGILVARSSASADLRTSYWRFRREAYRERLEPFLPRRVAFFAAFRGPPRAGRGCGWDSQSASVIPGRSW